MVSACSHVNRLQRSASTQPRCCANLATVKHRSTNSLPPCVRRAPASHLRAHKKSRTLRAWSCLKSLDPAKRIIRKLSKQSGKLAHLFFVPAGKQFFDDFLTRRVQRVRHDPPLIRNDGRANPAVIRAWTSRDKPEAFQFRDLPADRAVVTPREFREFDNTQRPKPFDPCKQRKKCTIQINACRFNKRSIRLRPIKHARQVNSASRNSRISF